MLDAAERAADAALNANGERMGAALEVVGALRQWHGESTSEVQPARQFAVGEEAELEQVNFLPLPKFTPRRDSIDRTLMLPRYLF